MEQLELLRELAEKLLGHQAAQWLLYAPEVRYLLLGLLLVFAISYVALLYNNLVRLSRNIDRAWSNTDVLLKQRHDELRKLVEVCKQYMEYEQSTLAEVLTARGNSYKACAGVDKSAVGAAEVAVRQKTHRLLALAEAYPALQSNASFKDLEKRLSDLEIAIADRREYYNETVTYYNTRIQSIPDNLIAAVAKYKVMSLIIVPDEEVADVDMGTFGKR